MQIEVESEANDSLPSVKNSDCTFPEKPYGAGEKALTTDVSTALPPAKQELFEENINKKPKLNGRSSAEVDSNLLISYTADDIK